MSLAVIKGEKLIFGLTEIWPEPGTGPAVQLVDDADYNMLPLEWWRETFYPFFRGELASYGIVGWTAQFDCDKWAKSYQMFGCMLHGRSKVSGRAQGIAVAVARLYEREHALNAVVDRVGAVLRCTFIEPQDNTIYTPTTEELRTCYLAF